MLMLSVLRSRVEIKPMMLSVEILSPITLNFSILSVTNMLRVDRYCRYYTCDSECCYFVFLYTASRYAECDIVQRVIRQHCYSIYVTENCYV
jgi:hypothetical protein